MTLNAEPFGVYVHWPFCAAKCPYCDFNSHVRHSPLDQAVFGEAYAREIARMASLSPGREVTSIFFGGGTPSLMEVATVGKILDEISNNWAVASDCEITLEANPTSVEAERFRGYRSAGVNRLSMGVQSLDDAELKRLGRLHSAEEAIGAIHLARETFRRLSFDLIYSRPGQHAANWEAELNAALDLAADHLSLYQLTIEEGTPFFDLQEKGRLVIPDQDRAAELYELTLDITAARGLPAYEISNHAAPGAECQHNLVYWRYRDYAGIGPGAHGRLVIDGAKHATSTLKSPEDWWQKAMVDGHGMEAFERLSAEETGDEFLLMGLRLMEGIDPARYERLSGRTLDASRIANLASDGFIETGRSGKLRVTRSGSLLLDAIVADLAA
ncbi:MAG: coproporphyrinogen III oxidase [Nitratireductor sp.]|nr:coproporphyrinogen III oxidase [Nitratireductor sp.]